MQLFNTPEHDIYQTIKSFVKIYPTYSKLYVYKEPIKVRIAGYEEKDITKTDETLSDSFKNPVADLISIRRSKTHISDIVLCNPFDLFATFTFKSDRNDLEKSRKKMSNWLQSQQKTHGKFAYLIIPEFHKDKLAIHFHALMYGYKGKLVYSGIKQKGRKVYNLPGYKSGFSTVVKITELDKVSSYIKKYITKDMPHFSGRKRYWHSTGLKMPDKIQNPDIDPFTLSDFTEEVQFKNLTILKNPNRIQLLN